MTPKLETVELRMNCSMLAGSPIPTTNNGNPSEWAAPSMDWDDDEEDEY